MDIIGEKNHVKKSVSEKLKRQFGKNIETASPLQLYKAVAMTARDEIMEHWLSTLNRVAADKKKVLYYLSLEFLTGKFLGANLTALGKYDVYREALAELGICLADLEDAEREPGLGNGGLGRLAACFLDSLAALSLPAVGCGIRYDLGLFRQKIVEGEQVELPDRWLFDGNEWEVARPEESVEICFNGTVREYVDETGRLSFALENPNRVIAVPYDIPVCGYQNNFCNTLRVWSAQSPEILDMRSFSEGDYVKASAERELAETISRILYPNDSHNAGKSLRLRQQYFFTSATLQYMLKRHKAQGLSVADLPQYVAVQINDTHPSIAIAELMRLLVDQERMAWEDAERICGAVFSYTNHTIMSEALETWPCYLMENLLPRIYMILCELDRRARLRTEARAGRDAAERTAIIGYGSVRMANLCMNVCRKVNGVSGLHTEILKKSLFADFEKLNPDQIIAVTNGVTPRRWLLQANPGLSALITETLGTEEWARDLSRLSALENYAGDNAFCERLAAVKRANKLRLVDFISRTQGISLDPDSIFDVQVKRLHEYKRQLLNVLHILYLYFDIVENNVLPEIPRTFLFGAKASPGYTRAKQIIALINAVAERVNNDPAVRGLLKIVFVENYNVTRASLMIPAADVSEQISLAGKEASGTGNMKFMLNGALTVGTLDGANVEMHDRLGDDDMFLFGLRAEQVENVFQYGRTAPEKLCIENERLGRAVNALADGTLPAGIASLKAYLLNGDGGIPDPYLCLTDFADYAAAQERVLARYADRAAWFASSARNIARSGFFSSDRAIAEYNEKIWRLDV